MLFTPTVPLETIVTVLIGIGVEAESPKTNAFTLIPDVEAVPKLITGAEAVAPAALVSRVTLPEAVLPLKVTGMVVDTPEITTVGVVLA